MTSAELDEPVELVQEPGPNELRDPVVRAELKKAAVWLGLAGAIGLTVLLIQPLLIIFGGLVLAAMLDGGVRLLRRVLPIPRGLRLAIVVLMAVAFVVFVFWETGVEIAIQAEQLRGTLIIQGNRAIGWVQSMGLMPAQNDVASLAQQALGSVGKLTSWVGTAFGAVASLVMVLVIGVFVAIEPKIYDRGLQWMVPSADRREFAITIERMAQTMRRLLAGRLVGMAAEGVMTWIGLMMGGVPMALLLGIITGMLAFIPNIGAFISGSLLIAVGFSAGINTGLWALGVYVVIQAVDGYVVIPMVARRTVDLPPALTLSAQILAGTLFGIVGLTLADPMTAMIKVALERNSERRRPPAGLPAEP